MLKGERREQKKTRKEMKKRLASNRKALYIIGEQLAKKGGK